jgi:hypothetical protein
MNFFEKFFRKIFFFGLAFLKKWYIFIRNIVILLTAYRYFHRSCVNQLYNVNHPGMRDSREGRMTESSASKIALKLRVGFIRQETNRLCVLLQLYNIYGQLELKNERTGVHLKTALEIMCKEQRSEFFSRLFNSSNSDPKGDSYES